MGTFILDCVLDATTIQVLNFRKSVIIVDTFVVRGYMLKHFR